MKQITVPDYICEFLIHKGVHDVFGYQGGMIAYLFDAFEKYKDSITLHVPYNEQGAAFGANGYAQMSGKIGFACSTCSPGFINLLGGMANAYFENIPCIFVAAEVNWKDKQHDMPLRQRGFQQMKEHEVAAPICKKVYDIDYAYQIKDALKEGYKIATSGRKGPVFLEIPINVFRGVVDVNDDEFEDAFVEKPNYEVEFSYILEELKNKKRPVIVAGAGINQSQCRPLFRKFAKLYSIPTVTSMPGVDALPDTWPTKFNFIGASGTRLPNYILSKADYVIAIGSRLAQRQVGHNLSSFAPKAKLIRFDLDPNEFSRQIKDEEIDYVVSIVDFLEYAVENADKYAINRDEWVKTCNDLRPYFGKYDKSYGNHIFEVITKALPENANIVLDVGKNELWGAQSTIIKSETRLLASTSFASMGYSLPAAIGAYVANKKPTYSFNGDGGLQMNIQELNAIARNNYPIKIFVLNNHALGNITSFQDQICGGRYKATKESGGEYFAAPSLKIAEAYGIRAIKLDKPEDISSYSEELIDDKPILFEIELDDNEPAGPNIVCGSNLLTSATPIMEEDAKAIKRILD